MIREKKTISGRLLEVDYYPVNRAGRRVPNNIPPPKTKAQIEAQQKYEKKRREKALIRKINANFGKDDYFLHPTYAPGCAPFELERARKDIKNYFKRIDRRRKKELKRVSAELKAIPPDDIKLRDIRNQLLKKRRILRKPLKWGYIIERVIYKTGVNAGKPNYHFHIFISGGLSQDEMERIWGKGFKVNARRYKPVEFGPAAAARYMLKDPQGERSYNFNRQCKEPLVKVRDGVCSRGRLEKTCRERVDDNGYWQRKFKGYKLLHTYPVFNQYNGQWYLSVVMYKTKDEPPPWEFDCWGVIDSERLNN